MTGKFRFVGGPAAGKMMPVRIPPPPRCYILTRNSPDIYWEDDWDDARNTMSTVTEHCYVRRQSMLDDKGAFAYVYVHEKEEPE